MSEKTKVWILTMITLVIPTVIGFAVGLATDRSIVHAQEIREVAPYQFADLPHGRIYKTVHEGCELYVVESDYASYTYTITAGRGCK